MKIKTTLSTIAVLAALAPAGARADQAKFDAAMQRLVTPYLAMVTAMAGDTDKGVTKAAKKMAKLAAKLDGSKFTGKHADYYKSIPDKIKASAKAVAEAKDLKAKREAFKSLSKPMALWATLSKPPGLNVAYCSMAPGSWLQKEKVLSNPYYGASMLRCGEILSGKDKGATGGHMKK